MVRRVVPVFFSVNCLVDSGRAQPPIFTVVNVVGLAGDRLSVPAGSGHGPALTAPPSLIWTF